MMSLINKQTVDTSTTNQTNTNHFLGMFARNKETLRGLEQYWEKRISDIIDNYFNQTGITAPTPFPDLIDDFKECSIPFYPDDVDNYLQFLDEEIVPFTMNTSSPRFIGHMTSALPYFVRPLSRLITALNQNMVKVETSKILTPCERQVIAMLHRLIYDFPEEFYSEYIQKNDSTLGMIVSGGTSANLTALWCARNSSLEQVGGRGIIKQAGVATALHRSGYQGMVIIGSESMHYSFEKAADILGFGLKNVIKVPVGKNGGMDILQLQEIIKTCRQEKKLIVSIIGIAGTTESGAIDPLREIAEIAREANIHFHVDAAWGGPALFSRQNRDQLAGIELADSVTIDGHKQLYLPMGIGMIFLKNPNLAGAIEKKAQYIIRKSSFDLGKRSIDGSRPAVVLFLHAALNIIGQEGYEFLIEEGIRKARYMVEQLKKSDEFELLTEPKLNIFLYRYIPRALREKWRRGQLTKSDQMLINQINEKIQKIQRDLGNSFISRTGTNTTYYGKDINIVALRAVISNPLTTESDIDEVLKEQIRIAKDNAID